MRIHYGRYKGQDSWSLENEQLRLTILPSLGAKIASLVYKPQNFEVFFQPTEGQYQVPQYGGSFADYDTSGADEMFPTIDPCTYPFTGCPRVQLPDHGELWSIPWSVRQADGRLVTAVKGVVLPYVFRRSMVLVRNEVVIDYQVTNIGDREIYGLWAFHGIVACDEDSKLILPEVRQILTVHDSRRLGPAGTVLSFPETVAVDGSTCRLDKIRPRVVSETEKFYAKGCLERGEAAVTLNHGKLLYQLGFPVNAVPYLGVWINEGGFKGEYNCALEPATGYYDSLAVASKTGTAQSLQAGDTKCWHLTIKLQPWE